jgi:putative ABC transport system permease protein
VLGVTIGVSSVVLLIAIGEGVRRDIGRQIESLGTNLIFILPGRLDRRGHPNPMALAGISTLTEADVESLRRVPGVDLAVPLTIVGGTVEAGKLSASGVVIAAPPSIAELRLGVIGAGRFYGPTESEDRVCVLGPDIAEDLFPGRSALGHDVRVGTATFRVVGVLRPAEESLFAQGGFQSVAYLPYAAAKRAFRGGQVNRIVLRTTYKLPPDDVIGAVRKQLLDNRGGREDFGILTQPSLLAAIHRVFALVTALLVGIGAISLVVAGIGIMNIMLVTVTERAREIGIRKAVGARQSDVFLQFLTEAVALSSAGGVLGLGLAWVASAAIGRFSALHPAITWPAVLLALGVCALVGVVFGVAPALRAAALEPIAALGRE